MLKLNKEGAFNTLAIPLVIAVVAAIGFGVLAYMNYANYVDQRDNNQPKIKAAVSTAEAKQKATLEAEFKEREKEPNESYTSPSEFGSVKVAYPKTWSAYVSTSTAQLNFYAHPAYVPATDVNYALRMSVDPMQFASSIRAYDSLVKDGKLKASSIKIAGVKGVRLDGFLKPDQEGTMVIFPLRDKTLRVWTENKQYRGDFNNIVIKKLTFSP